MTERAAECLATTRSAVLNVLIASGTGIAASGGLLRWRDRWSIERAPANVSRGLLGGLVLIAVASYAVRRFGWGRGDRLSRFYKGHVGAAGLAALAVPLGLAYGWLVRPRLDVVGPFWIVAPTLGFLALPRAHELIELAPAETGPEPSDPCP